MDNNSFNKNLEKNASILKTKLTNSHANENVEKNVRINNSLLSVDMNNINGCKYTMYIHNDNTLTVLNDVGKRELGGEIKEKKKELEEDDVSLVADNNTFTACSSVNDNTLLTKIQMEKTNKCKKIGRNKLLNFSGNIWRKNKVEEESKDCEEGIKNVLKTNEQNLKKKNEKDMTLAHKLKIIVCCFIMITVTGAAIFNWVDLRILLIRNGAYAEKCTEDELKTKGECKSQGQFLDDSFNIGVVFIKVVGVFTGLLLDLTGPKYTALLGLTLFATGIGCLSCNVVQAGLILLGCAMNPIFNSSISVANLFPRNRSFVICILSAGGDLSVIDFLIMRLISDAAGNAVSPKVWLLCYLSVVLFQMIVAFVELPRKSFEIRNAILEENCSEHEEYEDHPYWKLSRLECLKTLHFWVFLPFFVLLYFKKINYMRNVNDFIKAAAGNSVSEATLHGYITAYSSILCTASAFSLIVGFMADKIGVTYVILIVNVFSCLFSMFSLIPSLEVQILSFLSFTIFKCFILSSVYCFVADLYGFKNIGFITGAQQVVAGLFCLLNIPFQTHVIQGRWWINHLVLLILSSLMFLVPIFFLFYAPSKDKLNSNSTDCNSFPPLSYSLSSSSIRPSSLLVTSLSSSKEESFAPPFVVLGNNYVY